MLAKDLEKLCEGFKGTTRDIKWGNDLCYLVGGKMYCVLTLKGISCVSFKATPEDFALLTEREGVIPAPYAARYHWVLVENHRALSPREWKHYIQTSYQMVLEKLPKKLRASLE